MWLVVGLGNPGAQYAATRHNVGFRVVDLLAQRWAVESWRERFGALIGDTRRGGARVLLVKPQTHMNASGEAVGLLQRYHRVAVEHVVVVHDDVDLPAGRVRVRRGGRAGGNRGVESLLACLGDGGFVHVKVGVGRPPAGPVPSSWVLGVPAGDEAAALASAEPRAADAVDTLVARGLTEAMNRFNRKENSHGGSPL